MEAKMLEGKTAIITGAGYGMGQTMAELFDEEGADVVLTARGQEKLDKAVEEIRAKDGNAVGVVSDVCFTENTQKVIETAIKEFGDLDILINNISSVNGTRPFCGTAYTSKKRALNTLTKNVAMRLVDNNIRCNAVAPGATVTPAHLASKMRKAVRGQAIQICNGAFL